MTQLMPHTCYLSIVSPVYNAEKIVDELIRRISAEAEQITPDYEIVLVEDGGPDNSWARIKENCLANPKVKGIKLSRNFGQQYAISAGLDNASGEWVVVMDCDLQDNPKYIKDLLKKAQEGYDIIYTTKLKRTHNFFKNFFAKIYFIIFNYLTDNQSADDKTGAYSILNRKVVDAFCSIKDSHRHYLMILRILGFRSATITIEHEKRFEGSSSYNFFKLVKLALNGIVSQSDKLLRVSISIGFTLFAVSMVWAAYLVLLYFTGDPPPGYTSLMAMLLLSTGLILMSIGVAGIYIGKIFEQVKGRPLYFIEEKINA
jgi:glycosyltransferase involved in cell wall biosynthesis